GRDKPLDLGRRDPRDGPGLGLPSAQLGADVEPVAHAILAGKTRTHPVALVVEELALEQGTALREFYPALDRVFLQLQLNLVKGLPIEDRCVLSLEPFAAVMGFAKVDPVLEEIGEGAVGEGDAALVFRDLGVAPLGDNVPAVKLGDQFAERSQLEIQLEDGANSLGLGLVDDELLVRGVIAERNGTARPFPFLAGSRNLVPDPLGGKLPFELGKGQEDIEG